MAKPAVIVVGADKGGVGKTTVSRTVLDYFSANNVPTAHHAHQIPPMSMSHGLINMLRPSDPGGSHNAGRDCTKALISPAADLHHLFTGGGKRNANGLLPCCRTRLPRHRR